MLGLDSGGMAGLAGVLAVGTALKFWIIDLQIVQPLKQVLAQAQSVAAGQAGQNLHFDRIDEIGMLMRAVNQSGLNLKSLVDDVAQQVSGVRQASDTIASGNSDLSMRTDQAASQLQQTASSMSEMTATVRTNTETAPDRHQPGRRGQRSRQPRWRRGGAGWWARCRRSAPARAASPTSSAPSTASPSRPTSWR